VPGAGIEVGGLKTFETLINSSSEADGDDCMISLSYSLSESESDITPLIPGWDVEGGSG